MFERATGSTLKSSMLLYFAYADFEEGRVKYEKVHQIYQKFLEIEDIDPTLVIFNLNKVIYKVICFLCHLVLLINTFRMSKLLKRFAHSLRRIKMKQIYIYHRHFAEKGKQIVHSPFF